MQLSSYWQATAPKFQARALAFSASYDVAIIGGGFTGLSAARHLAKSGKRVVVLEAREVGHGASGRNGGHVNNGLAHDFAGAAKRLGQAGATALYQAYDAGVDLIEELVEEESIECSFRRSGKLKIASKPSHVEGLRANCQLLQQAVDPDTEFLDRADLTNEINSECAFGGVLYKRSAMMHVGRYLTGLANAAQTHGADIFEDCAVTSWRQANGVWDVDTAKGRLQARDLILATGAYTDRLGLRAIGYFRRRIIPVGSFIVATRPLTSAEIAASLPGNRTYVTSLNIGNYFRLAPDNRLVFGGRARFSATSSLETDASSAKILRRQLEALFPSLAGISFDYCFGGLVGMTQDRLPRAGQIDGVYYALGYSGHGVQMSNYMGLVLADMILGKGLNPLARLSWPPVAGHYGRPWFLPLVGQYYRMKDRFA